MLQEHQQEPEGGESGEGIGQCHPWPLAGGEQRSPFRKDPNPTAPSSSSGSCIL